VRRAGSENHTTTRFQYVPYRGAGPAMQGLVAGHIDTRAIQHYLGHRSIASTVRYTALAPDRFKGFWTD
jgi:tripartite-type tricarboxylate transporter receptor subunit TctC